MSADEWVGWRWWAVDGANGTDTLRLVGPFSRAVWPPGEPFIGRPSTSDAGVYAFLDAKVPITIARQQIIGWRARFPQDVGEHQRIVLGRVRLTGRLRSFGGQMVGDVGEVVSLDETLSGRVDLGRLRRLYS